MDRVQERFMTKVPGDSSAEERKSGLASLERRGLAGGFDGGFPNHEQAGSYQKGFAVAQDTQVGGSFPDPCADQGCTEWERCGQRHGNIGCVCTNQTHSGTNNTFDYSLSCNGADSAVSLSRCMLFDVGLSTDSLHLNDPSCVGNTIRGRVVFLVINITLPSGQKLFESKMVVYRDSGYSQPFNQTPVVLDINSKIYVGIIVLGVDASRFVLTLRNCWATPGSDPKQAIHWVFITEQCPTVQDSSVNVEESGHSTVARFSLSLFQFVGDSSEIYIHCQIQLCDIQSSRCLMVL
ncbi:uromodulin-like [Chiloscyllium punctatum]|uniref:uromodulin-like n=1 Tax=Chiloscyllium punctatum TaxID=137246 RepID=UPI003B633DC9